MPRVTSSAFSQRAIHFSSAHSANILKLQEQISSGVRFQRPSEEPISFRQLTSLKARYTELSADRSAINRATSVLNASVDQIQDFAGVINHAKTLTQQGIQALDDDERTALALEVDGLLAQLKSIASAQFNNKYLYGGTKSGAPPFEFSEPTDPTQTLGVTYTGSATRSRASVSDSIAVDTYYSGEEIFGRRGRGDTVLIGDTGAKPGSGTDTFVGRTNLLVTHDTTTYLGTSGLQAGTDSAASDTIIGPPGTYSVTIVDTSGDGSAGTISLNGSPPVAYTSADTNLKVEGSYGQAIYVDTTSIAAGFNGTVDLESTARMSIDGGQTDVAVDFTNNQIVVDSASQGAVMIDSTKIRQVGTDHLEFGGTTDAFQTLHALAADLRNTRGLDSKAVAESLNRRLGDLEGIAKNAFETMGEQSTALGTMQTLGFRVDDLMLAAEVQISETQATDLPNAVLNLENSQALLQYTYAVTADLSSLGLLEFLR
ncbi:MAG: flagellar hook-associated protein FlgL [Pirellulaceae bacterium]|nr:flagellar hook-associated protein FlgL [Pirellulaceae bacterium]